MGDKPGHPFRGNQWTDANEWANTTSKDWNAAAREQLLHGVTLPGGPRPGNPYPITARYPESDGPLPADPMEQLTLLNYYRGADAVQTPFTATEIVTHLNVGLPEAKEIAARLEKVGLLTKHDVVSRWDTTRGRSGTSFDRVNLQMKRKVQRYVVSGWTPARKSEARTSGRKPTE